MKHPSLPPVRWEHERAMCRTALYAADRYGNLGGAEYYAYAHDAAAWAVLGWAREQILKNDTGSISKIYDWNLWLEVKEQAESRKAARKGTS